MREIDRVYSAIVYLSRAVTERPDGQDYLPLLQKLKSEYDRLSGCDDLLAFARDIARSESPKRAANRQSNVIKLRA